MRYRPHMLPILRSDEIRRCAKGMPCTLRISSFYPGFRCADESTVVGCHVKALGSGMSTKDTDLGLAFGCVHCHDILDGRDPTKTSYIEENHPLDAVWRIHQAVMETQAILLDLGVIVVPDGEIIRPGPWRGL